MAKVMNSEFLSDESARIGLKQIIKVEYERLSDFYKKVNLGLTEKLIPEELCHQMNNFGDIETINQFIDSLAPSQLSVLNNLLEILLESSYLKYEDKMDERVQEVIAEQLSMLRPSKIFF